MSNWKQFKRGFCGDEVVSSDSYAYADLLGDKLKVLDSVLSPEWDILYCDTTDCIIIHNHRLAITATDDTDYCIFEVISNIIEHKQENNEYESYRKYKIV